MDIKSYLSEYLRITLASIKTPRKFFEGIKSEGRNYRKPIAYILITYAIYTAGTGIGGNLYYSIPISGYAVFLKYLLSALLFIVLMHLAVRLLKGKGSFNDTFKVICYSEAPLNFAWIFYVLVNLPADMKYSGIAIISAVLWIASNLYVYYIIWAGISVTSGITMPRAFAALMVQLIMFVVVIAIFISGLYQYSTDTHPGYSPAPYPTPYSIPYSPPNPEKYRITTYAGSPPQIDGAVTEEDKWYEGEQIRAGEMNRYYNITTKHDFEYIYILMDWKGPFEESNYIAIRFEQDEGKLDFNLSNGRADSYYMGDHLVISDTHYDSGYTYGYRYTDKEPQDGSLKGGYRNGKWILEWQIPMNSGDKYDIYVNKYPAELGFSIINAFRVRGIFPPGADNYDPRTWGTLTIVSRRK